MKRMHAQSLAFSQQSDEICTLISFISEMTVVFKLGNYAELNFPDGKEQFVCGEYYIQIWASSCSIKGSGLKEFLRY